MSDLRKRLKTIINKLEERRIRLSTPVDRIFLLKPNIKREAIFPKSKK